MDGHCKSLRGKKEHGVRCFSRCEERDVDSYSGAEIRVNNLTICAFDNFQKAEEVV